MVIGEDFFVTKGVEALIKWFGKRKEDKQITHDILLSLKINLSSIVLHMELSKELGHIKHKKLQPYLSNDIENLNSFLIKYQTKLDNGLYTELFAFINYLVEYNNFIKCLFQGMGEALYKYENTIKTSIDKYIAQIDVLIKELE